jgi:hypothetical protein
MSTDYTRFYRGVNFRLEPHKYRVGRGEQGVLLAEPYKSELLPHWRFRTPEIARQSSETLYAKYEVYRQQGDFVGYTRSRRYANHRTGRKYDGPVPEEHRSQSGAWGRLELPKDPDPVKAASAAIFLAYYLRVVEDPIYTQMRQKFVEDHKSPKAS